MATTRFVTIDDLERDGTPEGLWELIDGELVEVNPTGEEHNDVIYTLILHLVPYIAPRKLGKLIMPDAGVVVAENAQTVRSPDIGFIRANRLPKNRKRLGFFRVVPDLVVEVRSRRDTRTDLMAKGMMWLEAGVELIWLIDPITETVTQLGRAGTPRELSRTETLDGGDVIPGFRMLVSELFADPI